MLLLTLIAFLVFAFLTVGPASIVFFANGKLKLYCKCTDSIVKLYNSLFIKNPFTFADTARCRFS